MDDQKVGSSKLKPGDSLNCRVEAPEPGGYQVTLLPYGVRGFLPSEEPIEIGKVVPSTFVCMDGDKALLAYAYMIGTTERVQTSTASDSENAFAVWADSYPRTERLKRAIDLIMPPFAALPTKRTLPAGEADRFFSNLETDQFTGCIKVDSPSQPSRSAAVMFRGRAVGAIYTKKSMKVPYPLEASLMLMMKDLRRWETEIEYYNLADEFVLPLSTLFLGVAVDRDNDLSNEQFAQNVLKHLKDKERTACLSLQTSSPCGLGFVYRGEYKGAYSVEERKYRPEDSFMAELFDKFPEATLHAFVLPEVMISDQMRLGYSLTQEPFAPSID